MNAQLLSATKFALLGLVAAMVASLVVVALIGSDSATAAPNLVTNGDFATNDSGWEIGPGNTNTALAFDATGNPGGSAKVAATTLLGGDAEAQTTDAACIALTGDATYDLAADASVPLTDNAGATASASVEIFAAGDCSGVPADTATSASVGRLRGIPATLHANRCLGRAICPSPAYAHAGGRRRRRILRQRRPF